jgi:hypothetical protein
VEGAAGTTNSCGGDDADATGGGAEVYLKISVVDDGTGYTLACIYQLIYAGMRERPDLRSATYVLHNFIARG